MMVDPDIHRRKSIRLREYDYSRAGGYFVTICTDERECLFGEVINEKMSQLPIGRIAESCWQEIPRHFEHIDLDYFVVMPNHLHGILIIDDDRRGTACRAPTDDQTTTERFGKPQKGSIPTVIRSFKSAATKQINELRNTPGIPVWQRGFYDRVIRNDNELNKIREYILYNPLKWQLDTENPQNLDIEIDTGLDHTRTRRKHETETNRPL